MYIKKIPNKIHLTFCTNIFRSTSWKDCFDNLKLYLPQIAKDSHKPFGIGLKLSNTEVTELLQGNQIQEFSKWLSDNKYFISTINGFSYGEFHTINKKENIYLPDWSSFDRVEFTKKLITVASKLPSSDNLTISTVPIGFKKSINEKKLHQATSNLIRISEFLHETSIGSKKKITLALEPEPSCFLEKTEDVLKYFTDYLYNNMFYGENKILLELKKHVQEYIGICLDTCHFSVMYDDDLNSINRLIDDKINIFKVQLSSGLVYKGSEGGFYHTMKEFNDNIFLHQYSQKTHNQIKHFVDLPTKAAKGKEISDYRVHFHVPLHFTTYRELSGTQDFTKLVMNHFALQNINDMVFEVETYTFSVLPTKFQKDDITQNILKELEWVQNNLKLT